MVPNGTFLAMYPSDELPLSALPFRPKALVDVPLLSPGWGSVTGGGALRTGPLAMHPSVGFASLAKGCVSKEWRFLSDTPLCRLSEKNSGCTKCPQSDFLVSGKELFGRCQHQLILAALLLHPFGIKEVPSSTFLAIYPSVGWIQAHIGALLGWILASWSFRTHHNLDK